MLDSDSIVHTLSGPRVLGMLLAEELTYVLTWDGDRITVGQIRVEECPRIIIPYRIELDDDSSFRCCPETMLLLRNGGPRYPDQIAAETSMLPLYTKLDSVGYPVYQEPGEWHTKALTPSDRNRWRRLSRLVAEWKLGRRCEPGDIVSYASSDRRDCHPDNLKFDRKLRKKTQKRVDFMEPMIKGQKFIDEHPRHKTKSNHKIRRICLDTSRNLLSIIGLGTTNLAVGGVFASVDRRDP
jgi:hypothetical protein